MNFLNSKPMSQFTRVIQVFYVESFALGSQDLESSNGSWYYHVFNFEYQGAQYEFKVTSETADKIYIKDTPYTALLHRKETDTCLFEGKEQLVYM